MKAIRLLLYAGLFLFPFLAFSQKYTLRGTLIDTSAQPLAGATVMLLAPKDSALLAFTRSNEQGAFDFKNLGSGDYLLRCTYFSYKTLQKIAHLEGADPVFDLGQLKMELRSNLLGEVEITGEANPVTIKNDTIEFNAGSFKVKDNAMVEDLLKKLPGVEVAKDGTVKAQGKEVQNIMVEGKKFFGNDPKIATKNLPADAVDKVQVFDKKSDQATFSGIDDGSREKTINLDLKEDKKKGWFGKLSAAGGASEGGDARLESRLALNSFKPKHQISLLGMGNNTNEAGFSIEDYMAFSGAMRSLMSGGGGRIRLDFDSDNTDVPLNFGNNEGYIDTWAGGANFNREYGKKSDFNGSYFYSFSDKNYDEATTRTASLQDFRSITDDHAVRENITENHRLNLSVDQRIDSFNTVQLTGSFLHTQNQQTSRSTTRTQTDSGRLQNDGSRDYDSDATGSKWSGNALWRHKFASKKGRNMTANVNFGLNTNLADNNSFSPNRIYDQQGQLLRDDTIAQYQRFANDIVDWGAKATYTEPLGKRRYLEFNYGYFSTLNKADKDVSNVVNGEQSYDNQLSNNFENAFGYHRGGAGFRINRKSWSLGTGLDLQSAVLDGKVVEGLGKSVRATYTHLLPRMNLHCELGQNRNFDANYNASVNAPEVAQLQPVPDVSDPLNIYEGNPELAPEYSHQLNLNYVHFNPETFSSLFGGIFATYTQDKIVTEQLVDQLTYARRLRPVNTDYELYLNANMAYGWRIKKWDSRFRLHLNGDLRRGLSLINQQENTTTGTSLGPSLNWEFDPADWFNLSTDARLNWNEAHYSIDKAFDQSYLSHTYSSTVDVQLPKGFAINSSFDMTINEGLGEGYNKPIPIWNATVSKFLLKGKKLEIALTVRDILNRNIGISRSATLNFVTDRRVASLGRYGLLRLTYSLNSLGGPGGGRGPGMRMIIRH